MHHHRSLLFLLCACVLLLSGGVSARGHWNKVSGGSGTALPTGITAHVAFTYEDASASDTERTVLGLGHVELFDAFAPHITMYGNLHGFDRESNTWTQLETTGDAHPALAYARAVYHTARRIAYVLLGVSFGDGYASPQFNGQTRTFDPNTNAWTLLPTQFSPGSPVMKRRSGSCVALDEANDKLYVFGGAWSFGFLNDLWVLDLATNNWTMLQAATSAFVPPNTVRPGGRHSGGCAVSSRRGVLIVDGGEFFNFARNPADYDNFQDTWELNLSTLTWTRTCYGASCPGLTYQAIAISPDDEVVEYGGEHSGGNAGCGSPFNSFKQNVQNATLLYAAGGVGWNREDVHGSPPPVKRPASFTLASSNEICFEGGFDFECTPTDQRGQIFPDPRDVWCLNMRSL